MMQARRNCFLDTLANVHFYREFLKNAEAEDKKAKAKH